MFEQMIVQEFDPCGLKRVCEMREEDFPDAYGLGRVDVFNRWSKSQEDFYAFRDNGSPILAVAHLDTVVWHPYRTASFADTEAGPVVFSGALDDRLGAYTILELLPALGVNVDVLLTTGEEDGCSTAQQFWPDKDYHWMIEFDRGGTDVVMYQYEDDESASLVRDTGATVGDGIFSDIAFMEHLEIKGFNWGVGYRDYHTTRGHAFLEDYWEMIGYYLDFHQANEGLYLPHDQTSTRRGYGGYASESTREWEEWLAEQDRLADEEALDRLNSKTLLDKD